MAAEIPTSRLQGWDYIKSLIAGQTIKCAATFASLALAVCAGCGVCAMASGGGCAAALGTLSAVIGCNAALGVREALK